MRELALFAGAGGGLLGTHHLLGWTTCGYVEWNDYCQRVLAARIADGYLPAAPIFTDVRQFVESGAARQYRGVADVVSAGFPCQPFSVAGKQLAADDERNMWPATRDVIRDVQPRSVLLENVPGLVSCGYLGTVLADLAALGFVGRWGILGARHALAPHKRDRLWIVAHAEVLGRQMGDTPHVGPPNGEIHPLADAGSSAFVADPAQELRDGFRNHAGSGMGRREVSEPRDSGRAAHVADAERIGQQGSGKPRHAGHPAPHGEGQANHVVDGGWWETDPADDPESGVGRMAPRLADGVDRLGAIGNGQVPAVVRLAWEALS